MLIFTGLFINMIHRLNEQVLESPDSATLPRRKQEKLPALGAALPSRSNELSKATSTLKILVEENAKQPTKLPADSSNAAAPPVGNVSETTNNGEDGDDDDSEADEVKTDKRPAKRPKVI